MVVGGGAQRRERSKAELRRSGGSSSEGTARSRAQARHDKRSFREIRRKLLESLSTGQKNINELARSAGVNWKTTQNHLIYLCGFRYARAVVNLPQVKIYEITERGMEVLAHNEI